MYIVIVRRLSSSAQPDAPVQVGKVQPEDDKHHERPGGAALFCKLLTVSPS